MSPTAQLAVRRLGAAAESGDLADMCLRAGARLLVLFGSARGADAEPNDVDLAVRFEHRGSHDVLALLDELYRLTGYEEFDVLDLGRAGPLARERALVGARVLHEAEPGSFAVEQIAAIMERLDTDAMRRVELALMSSMTPRDLDRGVVQARLRLIEELLDDLERVGEATAEMLQRDRMLRHAIERILSQLVELAVSVNGHVSATVLEQAPKDYRSSFQLAADAGLIEHDLADSLQPSVGLRNVLAHEYVDIDLEMVVLATTISTREYRAYLRSASAWLLRQ